MSDHYKGMDEDGAYRSRHTAGSQQQRQQRRTTQSTASRASQRPAEQRPAGAPSPRQSQSAPPRSSADDGQYIGGSRRRTASQTPKSASTQTAPARTATGISARQTGSSSQSASARAGAGSSSRTPHRPAGQTAGASRPGSASARRPASERPTGSAAGSGFTVKISEDDYYNDDATMQEISAVRTASPRIRRSAESSSQNALVPADANPTTARRIVTGSMGDTYRIQDDGVMPMRTLRSRQKQVQRKNRGCVVALVYAAAVCSISILLAYYMIVGVNDMFALVKDSTDISVDVPKGADLNDVTKLLDESGVIEYPFFFKTYATFSKKNTGFKAGTFTLNSKSDYNQLLTKLRLPAGADKSTITVTIPEGLTVEQVAVIMEDNCVCDADAFLKTANEIELTQKSLKGLKTDGRPYKVEGYLYPDTYNFYLSEGSVNAINRLLGEFDKHWSDDYVDKAKERGMTMDEVIILASVVEREASKTEDRYGVASVFANRLKNSKGTGGKLQSDATRWYPYATKKELLASDKLTQAEKDDWINNNTGICDTYRIKGLPPCPICTPSLDSINAVLEHDNTSYYYFCSDANGKFYFAKTLNEHNANLKKAGLA